jgi:hypothetical protein
MINALKVVNATEHAIPECTPLTTGVTARHFCVLWPQSLVEAPKRCERGFFCLSDKLGSFLGAEWR